MDRNYDWGWWYSSPLYFKEWICSISGIMNLITQMWIYCLSSWTNSSLRMLQLILNMSARIVVGMPRFSHTPVCIEFHSLPIKSRINYKIRLQSSFIKRWILVSLNTWHSFLSFGWPQLLFNYEATNLKNLWCHAWSLRKEVSSLQHS